MIKRIIESIINKWFCLHEWKLEYTERVETDMGGSYTIRHYFCKKCGKYKRVKTY